MLPPGSLEPSWGGYEATPQAVNCFLNPLLAAFPTWHFLARPPSSAKEHSMLNPSDPILLFLLQHTRLPTRLLLLTAPDQKVIVTCFVPWCNACTCTQSDTSQGLSQSCGLNAVVVA